MERTNKQTHKGGWTTTMVKITQCVERVGGKGWSSADRAPNIHLFPLFPFVGDAAAVLVPVLTASCA